MLTITYNLCDENNECDTRCTKYVEWTFFFPKSVIKLFVSKTYFLLRVALAGRFCPQCTGRQGALLVGRTPWPGRIRVSEGVVTALVERTSSRSKMSLVQVGRALSGRFLLCLVEGAPCFVERWKNYEVSFQFLWAMTVPETIE